MGRKYARHGNGHKALAMEELEGRNNAPESARPRGIGTDVSQLKSGDLVNIGEVSVNTRSLFGEWAAQAQSYNPQDTLIGRKGMDVYDQMRTDDAIKASMKLKKGASLSTGWQIRPATDKPVDVNMAAYIDWVLRHLASLYGDFDDRLEECLTALDFGFSISELVLNYIELGPFAGKIGLKTIKTRRPHDFSFEVDVHDNLLPFGLRQGYNTQALPIEKFVIYTYQKEFGNWKGLSDLRSAYRPWWLKENLLRWCGIYAERFAMPTPKGTYPSGTQYAEQIAKFKQVLENWQANTQMTMPKDFDITLLEPRGVGVNIFSWLLRELDLQIARALLIPNRLGISAEPVHGSYAQSKKEFDIFMIVVEDIRRDISRDVVNNQIIRRLIDWSYGEVEEYPQFTFLPFTNEEEAKLLETWLNAVQGDVVKPTYQDEAHIRLTTGFPSRDETDADRKEAEAQAKTPRPIGPPKQIQQETQPQDPQNTQPENGKDTKGKTQNAPSDKSTAPAAPASSTRTRSRVQKDDKRN